MDRIKKLSEALDRAQRDELDALDAYHIARAIRIGVSQTLAERIFEKLRE